MTIADLMKELQKYPDTKEIKTLGDKSDLNGEIIEVFEDDDDKVTLVYKNEWL